MTVESAEWNRSNLERSSEEVSDMADDASRGKVGGGLKGGRVFEGRWLAVPVPALGLIQCTRFSDLSQGVVTLPNESLNRDGERCEST